MCLLYGWMASFVSTQELPTPMRLYTQQKMCIYCLGDCLQPQVLLFGMRRVRFCLFLCFCNSPHGFCCFKPSHKLYPDPEEKNNSKNSFTAQRKGFFFCSSYGRAEEKKVLIFSLRSHSVLLLTFLLADLCCTKPYWLLLFFVGIKKKC